MNNTQDLLEQLVKMVGATNVGMQQMRLCLLSPHIFQTLEPITTVCMFKLM